MKALTLYQPYASLVAVGAKTVETRSWGTAYRGPLLIHAAKRWDDDVSEDCRAAEYAMKAIGPEGFDLTAGLWRWGDTLGRVLALGRLADCGPMGGPPPLLPTDPPALSALLAGPEGLNARFGTFGPGRYGWVLADVRPLPGPIPWRGQMGLWRVAPELEAAVRARLAKAGEAPCPG